MTESGEQELVGPLVSPIQQDQAKRTELLDKITPEVAGDIRYLWREFNLQRPQDSLGREILIQVGQQLNP